MPRSTCSPTAVIRGAGPAWGSARARPPHRGTTYMSASNVLAAYRYPEVLATARPGFRAQELHAAKLQWSRKSDAALCPESYSARTRSGATATLTRSGSDTPKRWCVTRATCRGTRAVVTSARGASPCDHRQRRFVHLPRSAPKRWR